MSSGSESESNELLSALLDGELAGPELERLLADFERDPALRARWQRLCALRAVREGIHIQPQREICAGVMAALAGAPVPAQDTRVVPLPVRQRSNWRPAVGMAAAASLAAVAVVGAMRFQAASAPGSGNSPVVADAANLVPATAVADTAFDRLDPAAMRQLDDYVIEHANYRAGGMGGPLGYARFAAHTAEYVPADGSR